VVAIKRGKDQFKISELFAVPRQCWISWQQGQDGEEEEESPQFTTPPKNASEASGMEDEAEGVNALDGCPDQN